MLWSDCILSSSSSCFHLSVRDKQRWWHFDPVTNWWWSKPRVEHYILGMEYWDREVQIPQTRPHIVNRNCYKETYTETLLLRSFVRFWEYPALNSGCWGRECIVWYKTPDHKHETQIFCSHSTVSHPDAASSIFPLPCSLNSVIYVPVFPIWGSPPPLLIQHRLAWHYWTRNTHNLFISTN